MVTFLAPWGTPPPVRTIDTNTTNWSAVELTDAQLQFDFHAFPQRWMLGLSSEEDKLARTSIKGRDTRNLTIDGYMQGMAQIGHTGTVGAVTVEGIDIAYAARDLLGRVNGAKIAGSSYMDDKETVVAGNAKVYQAQSDGEAQRNLDFALANLTSYIRYVDGIKAEQEKRIAEAKRRAEEKQRIEEKQAARNKAGLDLYNKINGTRYQSWGTVAHAPLSIREKWSDKAEELTKLRRDSNPFAIMADSINAATISAANLRIGNYGF